MSKKYRWDHPLEWLHEYLGRPTTDLYNEASVLASQLDGDQIQDLYQAEMDADGYFNELSADEE